jgi:IS1 family transposase
LDDFSTFQEHVRVKRIQSHAFETDKISSTTHVLQCDFAMAYSCEYQSEIQSALWSRNSINLFTAALYSQDQACQSFLVVSDCQTKGKDAVYTFLHRIISQFEQQLEHNDSLIIYTDGPSSEFKNKFMAKLAVYLSCKLNCKVLWKYFATSHGKGVVDGIGGAAKSQVRRRVMSKGKDAEIVQNTTDFYNVVSKVMKGVKIFHITDADIAKVIEIDNPWVNQW